MRNPDVCWLLVFKDATPRRFWCLCRWQSSVGNHQQSAGAKQNNCSHKMPNMLLVFLTTKPITQHTTTAVNGLRANLSVQLYQQHSQKAVTLSINK